MIQKNIIRKQNIRLISGVGTKTSTLLEEHGKRLIDDLLKYEKEELQLMFGAFGKTLWHLAHGIDQRKIVPKIKPKSIPCEEKLRRDEVNFEVLKPILWNQSENLSRKAKLKCLYFRNIKLKLKTTEFKQLVFSTSLAHHTNSSEITFQALSKAIQKTWAKDRLGLSGYLYQGLQTNLSNFKITIYSIIRK